jgi:hypothetical protein
MARTNDLIYADECDLKWEALLFGDKDTLASINDAQIQVNSFQGARVVGKSYSYPLQCDPLVAAIVVQNTFEVQV